MPSITTDDGTDIFYKDWGPKEYLAGRGYSQVSYWKKTFIVSDFSRWLGRDVAAIRPRRHR
jgi:hypothetical protein